MSVEYRFVTNEWREFFHGKTEKQTEELIKNFLFLFDLDNGRGFEILTWEELKAWYAEWDQSGDEYPYQSLIEFLNDAIGQEIHLVRRVK